MPIRAGFRVSASGLFVTLGLLAPAHAWISRMRIERAMRRNRPPPASGAWPLAALAGSTALLGILAVPYLAGGL